MAVNAATLSGAPGRQPLVDGTPARGCMVHRACPAEPAPALGLDVLAVRLLGVPELHQLELPAPAARLRRARELRRSPRLADLLARGVEHGPLHGRHGDRAVGPGARPGGPAEPATAAAARSVASHHLLAAHHDQRGDGARMAVRLRSESRAPRSAALAGRFAPAPRPREHDVGAACPDGCRHLEGPRLLDRGVPGRAPRCGAGAARECSRRRGRRLAEASGT